MNLFQKSLLPLTGVALAMVLSALSMNALGVTPMISAAKSSTTAVNKVGAVIDWFSGEPVVVTGLTDVTSVSGRWALKSDSTISNWGYDLAGVLTIDPYPALKGTVAVSQSDGHTVALKSNGTVFTLGSNNYGQLGDGSLANRYSWAQVPGVIDIVAVSAGYRNTVALKSDGTVLEWGWNWTTPWTTKGLSEVKAVSAGNAHIVALKTDGTVATVRAWGAPEGLGTGIPGGYTSLPVAGLTGVVAIAAGYDHSVALKSDGTVVTWGDNYYGQLGDGTNASRLSPAAVPGLTGVVAISAGFGHTVALKSNGTVVSWGSNSSGQLGDGTTIDKSFPVVLPNLNLRMYSDARIFEYAEQNYASFFAGTPTTDQTVYQNKQYNYRYYPASGNYLAVVDDVGSISIRQSSTGNDWTVIGSAELDGSTGSYITSWEAIQSQWEASQRAKLEGTWTISSPQESAGDFNVSKDGVISGLRLAPSVATSCTVFDGSSAAHCGNSSEVIDLTFGTMRTASDFTFSGKATALYKKLDVTGTFDTSSLVNGTYSASYDHTVGTSTGGYGTSGNKRGSWSATKNGQTDSGTQLIRWSPVTVPGGLSLSDNQVFTLNLLTGWNLVGNSVQAPITVATSFNDSTKVTSVWKWVTAGTTPGVSYPNWAYYSPASSDGGKVYAASKGYDFLVTINSGEGYWVNANATFTAQLPSGTAVASSSFKGMSSGWHLISTGTAETPSSFNSDLSTTSAGAGTPLNITTLWAWDIAKKNWYFYAPSLEAKGENTLFDFITNKGYLNFTTANKTLGPGVGFWVNKP